MLPGLRSDLSAHTPSAVSSVTVRPSKLDRSHPLVAYPSASAVPMFPAIPPSYLLLCTSSSRLSASRLVRIAVAARVALSCPVPLGSVPFVAVVRDKRDNKSEKKKRGE